VVWSYGGLSPTEMQDLLPRRHPDRGGDGAGGAPEGAEIDVVLAEAHAPDQVRIGAFAGAGFGRGQSVELEAADEVVARIPSCCQALLAP